MANRELAGIAARLYALPFDDFVAARNNAAKELLGTAPATPELKSRVAQVRAMPKPSVGAWAVNMLALHRPDTVRALIELGQEMRGAQDSLDAAALRNLGRERRKLLATAVDAARAVTVQQGRTISTAIAAEVEQTLRAATADEGAAAAVRSGRLLRSLSADGVDVVELDGAVALPDLPVPTQPASAGRTDARTPGPAAPDQPRLRAVRPERPAPTPSVRERAEAALALAAEAALSSAAEAEQADAELAEAAGAAAAVAKEAAELKEKLARAEDGLRLARKRLGTATTAAQLAARMADKDRRREDLARERVLRLGNTPGG